MTAKFLSLTLGCTALLLAACSQTPAPDSAAANPYAGGAQYPWSSNLEAAVADPYAAGRSYPWTSPTAASAEAAGVNAQALSGSQNALSDLPWTSATNGWGPVERNRSNGEQNAGDGKALSIGGQTFAKGLGVHAGSEIRYALGGACNTFTASVGLDGEVGSRGSVRFKVFGDGKELFDSGVLRGGGSARAVGVSVAGVKELRLSVGDGGDGIDFDHADWGEANVNCAAAQPTGNAFLSDQAYTSASSGWGPVEFDRSNGEQVLGDGKTLTIGGKTFAKGLGVHAASVLNYDLGGACTTFTASLGIDDEVGDRGSVAFQVFGDGKKLYDSGVLRGSDSAKAASVPVSGVKALKLVVTDAGDNIDFDHADWADAKLNCQGGTATPSIEITQQGLQIFHKHSANLPVTFKNISGPVNLRLEIVAGQSSGLKLDTTTLNLSGTQSTRNLQISAPTVDPSVRTADSPELTANFTLIASQNGQDIASSAVTLEEKLLVVTAYFEPARVTPNRSNPPKTTLVVVVSPPLDAPVEIRALTGTYDAGDFVLTPLGTTYGDGGTMRRDYAADAYAPNDGEVYGKTAVIYASDFAGYRLPGYWTKTAVLETVTPAP